MDREDFDNKLNEEKHPVTGFRKNHRKIIAAAAMALIVAGGTGCFFFHNGTGNDARPASSYSIPNTPSKEIKDLPAVRNTAVVQAVKNVGPAVVGITTRVYDKDMFNRRVEVGQSVGSGVIFDKKGYIVTNNHVVSGSTDVNVSLSSGKTVSGKVIGTDESTDLAVVKIDGSDDLPVAAFGDSDSLQVGETAIAIGNPLGLEFSGTVTVGVISALNRTIDNLDQRFKLIQTDAAINPGNSGGALVTADGKVVGINSAKIAKEGVEGMGFAIPINSAKKIIEELIQNGHVTRAYLGAYAADQDLAARYGYSWDHDGGVLIMKIASGSPLADSRISVGDYIMAIDGQKIDSVRTMRDIIDNHKPGDTVTVQYEHNGNTRETKITLAESRGDE